MMLSEWKPNSDALRMGARIRYFKICKTKCDYQVYGNIEMPK